VKKPLRTRKNVAGNAIAPAPVEASFAAIVGLIQAAKQRTYQAVNTELVSLYWQIGEYISRKLHSAEWGDGVVEELARYLARTQPGLRGFTRANLFRMRQFYDTREKQIKKWNRAWKIELIERTNPQWQDLWRSLTEEEEKDSRLDGKAPECIVPAEARTQELTARLDSRFRGNDGGGRT
jgi:hypothetical protein